MREDLGDFAFMEQPERDDDGLRFVPGRSIMK
jgi:hypothetical protein